MRQLQWLPLRPVEVSTTPLPLAHDLSFLSPQAVNTVWAGIVEPSLDPLVSTLLEADYGVAPLKQDGL
jgi:hypothetical protein